MTVQVKASADNTYGALQVNGVDKVYFGKTGDNLEIVTNSTLASYSQRSLTAAVATTSGTAIDFTGIPSWAKKITVLINGVSTNGTSPVQVQLGTSAGVDSAGYSTQLAIVSGVNMTGVGSSSTGISTVHGLAASARNGHICIALLTGLTWVSCGVVGDASNNAVATMSSSKTLSGTLDRIRLTTVNGTDTFDAGSVSLLIEG